MAKRESVVKRVVFNTPALAYFFYRVLYAAQFKGRSDNIARYRILKEMTSNGYRHDYCTKITDDIEFGRNMLAGKKITDLKDNPEDFRIALMSPDELVKESDRCINAGYAGEFGESEIFIDMSEIEIKLVGDLLDEGTWAGVAAAHYVECLSALQNAKENKEPVPEGLVENK